MRITEARLRELVREVKQELSESQQEAKNESKIKISKKDLALIIKEEVYNSILNEKTEVPDEYLEWWLKNGRKDLEWYGGSLGSAYGPKYMAKMWKDSKKWEEFFAKFPTAATAEDDKDSLILKISTEFLEGDRDLKQLQPPVDLDKAAERVSFIMSYYNTQDAEDAVDKYLKSDEANKKGLDPKDHRDEILNRVNRMKNSMQETDASIDEVGYYGLGAEPFGAEKYRKKIKGFVDMLDKAESFGDPMFAQFQDAIKLSVSEMLLNIEDEDMQKDLLGIVHEVFGKKYDYLVTQIRDELPEPI
tara:strand:- start:2202 stop:3110 length:909 start_codon:yes stop_codon:yes gene_type:complete